MTPIWSATSNRPEPSSSGNNAVGEVKPSAIGLRPIPDPPSAAFTVETISNQRQIEANESPSSTWYLVFTPRTLVWCLRNSYKFVALKLTWGAARRRESITRSLKLARRPAGYPACNCHLQQRRKTKCPSPDRRESASTGASAEPELRASAWHTRANLRE